MRRFAESIDQGVGVLRRRDGDDERVEIVVIVLAFRVVMRGPRREIVLRRRLDAEEHVHVDDALSGRGDLHRARQGFGDLCAKGVERVRRDEVGLVEDDEIGAEKLVLVDLLERIVMIERGVGRALLGDPGGIVGEAAFRDRGRVDDRDDAVDG